MKKKWIWICMLLTIAVGICVFFSIDKLIIERNNESLDVNYASFQEINEHYRSGTFEVALVAKVVVSSAASPNPIRIFSSVNDQLILGCDARVDEETKDDTRYYKIDKTGKVADSIYDAYDGYWAQFIDDFIVYTSDRDDYYTTWPLNGDTVRHKVIELNADLSWDHEKVSAGVKAIKATAKYWFFSSFANEGIWYRKTYFYADRQWKLLWQKMPGYTDIPNEESSNRYRKDIFRSGEYGFERPDDVKLFYFYPEEKIKYYHIIGGGDGGFSVYNWRGRGFFETSIAGKNFQFMVPQLVVENEKHDGFKSSLYIVREPGASCDIYNPAFYHSPHGFSFYSPDPKQLFLIKVK
ncbi:hypothetical protein [Sphingobacterium sp.]|uniref:hypothetical protein n=1 Tax=Sphingobacterium sp. TaxID=341027 RepID=UPI0028A5F0EE|nr:hypothetical protein [Sphingobacterium sp.]